MSESKIERDFCKWVHARGGLCLKQNPNWYHSIPDRLIIIPPDRAFFIEFKQPGGTVRPGQAKAARVLRRRRFRVYFCSSLSRAKVIYRRHEKKAATIPE